MAYILLHNPGCSTSRKGLELLKASGIEPSIRKYMNDDERLTVAELKEIAAKLGGVSPRDFMRAKEAAAAGIDTATSDAAIYKAMVENPRIIQRPIGIKGQKAALGRPPESLLDIT